MLIKYAPTDHKCLLCLGPSTSHPPWRYYVCVYCRTRYRWYAGTKYFRGYWYMKEPVYGLRVKMRQRYD